MSQKERQRYHVLKTVIDGQLSINISADDFTEGDGQGISEWVRYGRFYCNGRHSSLRVAAA